MQTLATKSTLKPAIAGVLITPTKLVATDSFRLMEYTKASAVKEPVIIRAKGFKGTNGEVTVPLDHIVSLYDGKKLLVVEQVTPADEFPNYEAIIPTTEPVATVTMNPELLAGLLDVCARALKEQGEKHTQVTIAFHADKKPLVITGENIRALIMPIVK